MDQTARSSISSNLASEVVEGAIADRSYGSRLLASSPNSQYIKLLSPRNDQGQPQSS